MTIGPKGGPLEKTFLETCFYELKRIVLMKENVFDGFKAFSSIIRTFQICLKKVKGVTIGPKGGPLEKNFFETCFYELKRIVLMKENVFDGFKAFSRIIRTFQIWLKKV